MDYETQEEFKKVYRKLKCKANCGSGGGSGWSLTGNADTDPSTNFLGTTDAQPLILKSNNKLMCVIDGDNNDFFIANTDIDNADIAYCIIETKSTDNIDIKSISNGEENNVISFTDIDGITFKTLGIERLRIDNATGDIGIGTQTPTQKLDVDGNIKLSGALITTPQYVEPLTGDTITSDGSQQLIVNPLGTLPALTIDFPATPVNGQCFSIACTQIITGLTLTASATILGMLTTFASVNGTASWIYSTDATAWVRQK